MTEVPASYNVAVAEFMVGGRVDGECAGVLVAGGWQPRSRLGWD
jgi:hypothetical protein